MGTTLTALLTDGAQVALVHVGDSRAYLLRDGELTQLTRDQTYVQTLVDAGVLTRDEARHHPRSNVVLQAWTPSVPPCRTSPCSTYASGTGCWSAPTGSATSSRTRRCGACPSSRPGDAVVDRWSAAALAAGGRDNVTCLVSDVEDGPRVVPDGRHFGAFCDPYLVVDPAAVHALPG